MFESFIDLSKWLVQVDSYNLKSYKPGQFALKWSKDFFVDTSLLFPKIVEAFRLRNIHVHRVQSHLNFLKI